MSNQSKYGTNSIVRELQTNLASYLEAQYHVRDESYLALRRALFEREGILWQEPHLEATMAYEPGKAYDELALPEEVSESLSEISRLNLGLPPVPYEHQASALEHFFAAEKKDLVISTGTGSGKTEAFLMPLIGQLAIENKNSISRDLPGVRALLLYPMNALVNDQMSRVRRIIGNEQANDLIRNGRERPLRFASYTSRTPYAGRRTAAKDRSQIEPMFLDYYLNPHLSESIKERMKEIGKWPAKDLDGFFAEDQSTYTTIRRGPRQGQERHNRNFSKRLRTQGADRELMMRHEVQEAAPEILITNYSMLEYMLLRPIEAPIFSQTREWLEADHSNEFLLVVDEAHMYRGTGGAEVAFLIRRLCSRLGISRERMRVILTSASLGPPEEADSIGTNFASDLTGTTNRGFSVVLGTPETRPRYALPNEDIYEAIESFDIDALENFHLNPAAAVKSLTSLGKKLEWTTPSGQSIEEIQSWLYEQLQGFGPAEILLASIRGQAVSINELRGKFKDETGGMYEIPEQGLASLVAICAFAKRSRDQKVFLPARLHLMYRGVQGIYACINPNCTERAIRDIHSNLGSLRNAPSSQCKCGGRVFELYTHRDCGRAFIVGFVEGPTGNFLWSEPTSPQFQENTGRLYKVEILIDQEPHATFGNYRDVWIDTISGRLSYSKPSDYENYLHGFAPTTSQDNNILYERCPCCTRTWQPRNRKIMDLATKGEAPFANLVKTLLFSQPAVREEDSHYPNGGRKVLLFSDGRQKAARLARDIPREVLSDTFRQLIALAHQRLLDLNIEPRPSTELYIAFVSLVSDLNLSLFDGEDAEQLRIHVDEYREEEDLEEALDTRDGMRVTPVGKFWRGLLEIVGGRYYSIYGTTIGYLDLAKKAKRSMFKEIDPNGNLPKKTTAILEDSAKAWVSIFAENYSFGAEIDGAIKAQAAGYYRPSWGRKDNIPDKIKKCLQLNNIEPAIIESFRAAFSKHVLRQNTSEKAWHLNENKVALEVALNNHLYSCIHCLEHSFFTIGQFCANCCADEIEEIDPAEDQYIRARKGFWRDPVARALRGEIKIRGVDAQEHSAQLSHRDTGSVHSTTEKYELRFQDICSDNELPIDILSSTTTMEVGIDIGSLIAVGLRNVPPQRENYQQRAGRAGRRGSAVSTVVTFAQNGPHDAFYFENPKEIVAGAPRTPEIKVDNPKIAKRHVSSFLLSSFFHGELIDLPSMENTGGKIESSLGRTSTFFLDESIPDYNFPTFRQAIERALDQEDSSIFDVIEQWLPDTLVTKVQEESKREWLETAVAELLARLEGLQQEVVDFNIDGLGDETDLEELDDYPIAFLLEFLFHHGLLPSYAFPTDVASFLIEKSIPQSKGPNKVGVLERPQQAIGTALSEYAPGRLVVVNKLTYRVGGVVADCLPTEYDRSTALFEKSYFLSHCNACNHVENASETEFYSSADIEKSCPICSGSLSTQMIIQPEVFTPERAQALKENDNEQEITYATYAQFPTMANEGANEIPFNQIGTHLESAHAPEQRLVTLNKGVFSSETDEYSGFHVCDKCGKASTEPQPAGAHYRTYLLERNFAKDPWPPQCDGEFKNIFLGYKFLTDLMLLRISVSSPLKLDTADTGSLATYENALFTIAEAMKLAATRHKELDLDESELGAGFRVIPATDSDPIYFDIYLYDTLSGGAGYSEIVNDNLSEILQDTLVLLEGCSSECDRSCQSCLRHYRNQHIQNRLDRHIGAELLRYAIDGTVLIDMKIDRQIELLEGLSRMMQIDGAENEGRRIIDGIEVPVIFKYNDRSVGVCVYSSLLDIDSQSPETLKARASRGIDGIIGINEYFLKQNLPEQHLRIRRALGM